MYIFVQNWKKYKKVQFFLNSFSATPETPLPSPPQGSGQEYKMSSNQASVIAQQSILKQKSL